MRKINILYDDQPLLLPILQRDAIHLTLSPSGQIDFPFPVREAIRLALQLNKPVKFCIDVRDLPDNYIEDLVRYLELELQRNEMYLRCHTALAEKAILLEESGIRIYLHGQVGTNKRIYIEFARTGYGLQTLGAMDPWTLGELDGLSFADISVNTANWMLLGWPSVAAHSGIYMEGLPAEAEINSSSIAQLYKGVLLEELSDRLRMQGLTGCRSMSLGELDAQSFTELDLQLLTFYRFEKIPARLGKTFIPSGKKMLIENGSVALIVS